MAVTVYARKIYYKILPHVYTAIEIHEGARERRRVTEMRISKTPQKQHLYNKRVPRVRISLYCIFLRRR